MYVYVCVSFVCFVQYKSAVVKSFLAGSFSGTCSTILFQPLDLIKTRLQLLQKTQHSSRTIVGIAYVILREQKVFALWTGLVPVCWHVSVSSHTDMWDKLKLFIMAVLCSRCGHYIFALWFLLSIFVSSPFFPRLISAVADWMSTILRHMVWSECEFRMQVCVRLAGNTGPKTSP